MQGEIVNGYMLKHLLGEGGMAEVWYAENEIGMPAAVKILYEKMTRNEQMLERFHNEAVVMVKLNHPNIRKVYGYGYIGNRHCIIMEYLEGNDLGALLQSGKRFSDEELRRWWDQIADALNYTHVQGIVHRDIKPSNLFLDKNGNIKLLDFGIAKIMENDSMTRTGSMMGTLMYMSPEQVRDSKYIDHHTDVYSLAVTFVHLLSGKVPYDINTSGDYEVRRSIVEQPLDLSGVPTAWRNFLKPYLAKAPDSRPALRHFDPKTQSKPVETKPQPSEPSGKPKSKTGLWIALGVVAAVAVLLVLLLNGSHNGHEYVDLGLPSGTLWATCNIGTNKPEDYGNYYAWGETSTKSIYDESTYKYVNGDSDKLTKYCNKSDYGNNGFTDNLTSLKGSDDPATANWGSGWCIPSEAQWEELLANTTNQWTTMNGVEGRLFTAKNGQTLFLPAAGYRDESSLYDAGSDGSYWSSSLSTDFPSCAWYFFFSSGDYVMHYSDRDYGSSVRAVRSAR